MKELVRQENEEEEAREIQVVLSRQVQRLGRKVPVELAEGDETWRMFFLCKALTWHFR